jgi:NADP-reducing hydrogenase subunit HndD
MKKINIYIDGKACSTEQGNTVLNVARQNGTRIPSLCFHPDLKAGESCRLCVVEVKGKKGLFTSCSLVAEEGMEIITNSPKVKKTRKINLELIFAQHREECDDCVWKFNCKLLQLAKEFNVDFDMKDRKSEEPKYNFGPAIHFDSTKCMDCQNCVEACAQQVDFLEVKEGEDFFSINPSKDRDCIYCGQCIMHCPVGAFEGVGEFEEIDKVLLSGNKHVVVQFAPSIRVSIGEEFGMGYGKIVTGQLVAGIRKLGIKKVFDVSVGADLVTMEEAEEFKERINNNGVLPIITSCCPGWVKYVEYYRPDLIPNLTTIRSPQTLMGGLIKTYWAKKNGIDPKDIIVVSIMPCTAKKYEITKEELLIDGIKPVDHVLTTRELAYAMKKKGIDLGNLKPEKADVPLGDPSGAGVIYGAAGGVIESALRTAYFKIIGKNLKKVDFDIVRGIQKCKTSSIKIGDKKINIAAVSGIKNTECLLKNMEDYHYIEVMACPGGCISGGGQPIPTTDEIRKMRIKAIYGVDKKKKIRMAHENLEVKELYNTFFKDNKNIHKVCHTVFSKKKRTGAKKLK